LFQHRFTGLGELKGHSLGNLIVAAMFEMTGDFDKAVRETSKVLAIRGRVLPSTLDDVRLGAELEDGTRIEGQVNVNNAENIANVYLIPEKVSALNGVVKAIQEAEMIVIGPGSLFTSIIPNLLVPEIAEAIKASKAPKIYVCNVMTQPNETLNFTAADHVRALIRHIGKGVITHVLINSAKVPPEILQRYEAKGAKFIQPEETEIEMLGVRPIHGPFIDVSNVVRHNPQKLAQAIFRIAARL
ncbi:YvcK family protein, partial [bacterium]